jgi:hypothetical protein
MDSQTTDELSDALAAFTALVVAVSERSQPGSRDAPPLPSA